MQKVLLFVCLTLTLVHGRPQDKDISANQTSTTTTTQSSIRLSPAEPKIGGNYNKIIKHFTVNVTHYLKNISLNFKVESWFKSFEMPICTKVVLFYTTNVYFRLGSLIITPIKMLSLALLIYFPMFLLVKPMASITLMILYHLLNSFSIKLNFVLKLVPKKFYFSFCFNSLFFSSSTDCELRRSQEVRLRLSRPASPIVLPIETSGRNQTGRTADLHHRGSRPGKNPEVFQMICY